MNNKPFQTIKEAAQSTGLSQYFLRHGCWDGSVPCVRSGSKYLVNVPALLRQLGAVPFDPAGGGADEEAI